MPVSAFAPQGDVNYNVYSQYVHDLLNSIDHKMLQQLTRDIVESSWNTFREVPAANSIHHAYVHGLMKHSVDVTLKARAIASMIPECDYNLVTAGALVHDIGKIITYRLNGAVIEFTEAGNMFEHIVEGVKYTERFRTDENAKLLDLLQHIITSHHGRLEYGSPMEPKFLEAHIVCAADGIDAKVATILEANAKSKIEDVYTDKIWVLGNKPQFTQTYVNDILSDAINWDEEHPLDPLEVDGE
ncbi:3'-5' exoribonuclease YhaM [compost metagenome]